MQKENEFGTGEITRPEELISKNVFITSAACLTVTTETQMWASSCVKSGIGNITPLPETADVIIVLACQVTDLAILNDFKIAERYQYNYPKADIYIGGCLAQRFDIEMPEGIGRIDHLRDSNSGISVKNTVFWEDPFWIEDFHSRFDGAGELFREEAPVMLGSGCHGKCKYCTIKVTRGTPYKVLESVVADGIINNDSVVFVADTISVGQIEQTASLAIQEGTNVSYRNVEPDNLVKAENVLINLAKRNLLDVVHCPVQSDDPNILEMMGRNVEATFKAIEIMYELQKLGVYIATNIIIDYKDEEGNPVEEETTDKLHFFDHIAWNPYWDGKWDREEAEKRFKKYITER